MPEFASSSPTLLDAWLDWKISPYFQVLAGKSRMPVGLERIQSRENNLMTEFGYPSSLVPNRDIGVAVHGALVDGVLDYYRGCRPTGRRTAAVRPAIRVSDVNLVARLFANPFNRSEHQRRFGVWDLALVGRTAMGGGALRNYNSVGQQTFYHWFSGVAINGTTWLLDPQALLLLWALSG